MTSGLFAWEESKPSSFALTPRELKHYEEHGYVIVRGVLGRSDFAPLQNDLESRVAAKAKEWLERGLVKSDHAGAPFESRLARLAAELPRSADAELGEFGLSLDTMYARAEGCFRFFFTQRLLDAIESLVGGEITLSPIQHLRPFLPAVPSSEGSSRESRVVGAATVAPWHQDMGVTREDADGSTIVTCWIPLVDATKGTGCMRVIPDQHDASRGKGHGLLPHVKDPKVGTTIDPRALPRALLKKEVACEMKRGDILLMHHFTPHRSAPNTSEETVRWSIDLRFQKTGTPTGRPFWPELIVRSLAEPSSEQRDYRQWCERWVSDLETSKGERWHRVAGDVGGGIGAKAHLGMAGGGAAQRVGAEGPRSLAGAEGHASAGADEAVELSSDGSEGSGEVETDDDDDDDDGSGSGDDDEEGGDEESREEEEGGGVRGEEAGAEVAKADEAKGSGDEGGSDGGSDDSSESEEEEGRCYQLRPAVPLGEKEEAARAVEEEAATACAVEMEHICNAAVEEELALSARAKARKEGETLPYLPLNAAQEVWEKIGGQESSSDESEGEGEGDGEGDGDGDGDGDVDGDGEPAALADSEELRAALAMAFDAEYPPGTTPKWI